MRFLDVINQAQQWRRSHGRVASRLYLNPTDCRAIVSELSSLFTGSTYSVAKRGRLGKTQGTSWMEDPEVQPGTVRFE